jgi:hypothetical protein
LEIYTFKIQAELVHRIGSLVLDPGEILHFAQIYILESLFPMTPTDIRLAHHHGRLNEQILWCLTDMLDDINPSFHIFRTASERLQESHLTSLHLMTVNVSHLDSKQYNQPTAAEVAIIMPGTNEELVNRCHIVLHSRTSPL